MTTPYAQGVNKRGNMDTFDHAKRYIRNGWSVIPLAPRTKDTPILKWGEFQERYATDSELTSWFKGTNNNIGIVTGKISNLTVLDADGTTGLQDLVRLGLASPVTSISGSGAKHLFYKHSGQTNKRKSQEHQGLDSRGEGGYVAAAPSIHPNGNRYRWANGAIPNSSALPDWPKGLLEDEPTVAGAVVKATEPWILTVLKGVGSGERHQALVRLACYLIPRHHYDIVKQNLLDWNQKNNPPLPDAEVVKQLDDLVMRFKKGKYKTTYVAPKEFTPEATPPSASKLDIEDTKSAREYLLSQLSAPVISIPELSTGYATLDDGFFGLKRGNVTIFGARPGTGKTTLACNIVANLCRANKRVLYFSTEMSREEIIEKFAAAEAGIEGRRFQDKAFTDADRAKLVQFIPQFEAYDLHTVRLFAPDIEAVRKAVLEIKPDVVVFDHIQHTGTEGDNEYRAISKFIRFLKAIAMQTNSAILVNSQLSRSAVADGVVPELQHLKSCGTLEEEASVVLLMHDDEKQNDRPILVKIAKNRFGKCGSGTLMFRAGITKFEDMGVAIS